MTERELLQQVLGVLHHAETTVDRSGGPKHRAWWEEITSCIDAILAYLAEPPAEPVAWWRPDNGNEVLTEPPEEWGRADEPWIPLYTAPPAQLPAKPLTDEQIAACWPTNFVLPSNPRLPRFARAIEREVKRAHGIT